MKWIPAGHRVLVKLKEIEKVEEKKSKGGIVLEIVDSSQHRREQFATTDAYVMALGQNAYKGFDDGKPWCKVGDLVKIAKYAGENIEDEDTGIIYRVINDEDVFVVLNTEEDT